MRFVEDNRVCRWQQFGDAGVFQCDVCKEQMMVDHHDIGLLRFLTRFHHETVLVILAFRTQAGVTGRCHQVPDQRGLWNLRQFCLVTGTGGLHEA